MANLDNVYNAGRIAARLLGHSDMAIDGGWLVSGGYAAQNNQHSYEKQIAYEEYLKQGYQRQLDDWKKGFPNRTIRYPELSYPGQIMRSDTAIARDMFGYDNASAGYLSNLPYRGAGLYGIGGKLARRL